MLSTCPYDSDSRLRPGPVTTSTGRPSKALQPKLQPAQLQQRSAGIELHQEDHVALGIRHAARHRPKARSSGRSACPRSARGPNASARAMPSPTGFAGEGRRTAPSGPPLALRLRLTLAAAKRVEHYGANAGDVAIVARHQRWPIGRCLRREQAVDDRDWPGGAHASRLVGDRVVDPRHATIERGLNLTQPLFERRRLDGIPGARQLDPLRISPCTRVLRNSPS
jgi:hypothetical protein